MRVALRSFYRRCLLALTLITIGVVTASAQSQQTIIYDDFVGPGGTSLATHAPDTNLSNGVWSIGGGPGLIFWGQGLRASNTGTYDVYATIESGVSDGNVGASWLPVAGEDASLVNGGVIFRYASPTSYWLVNYFQGQLALRKMTSNGFVMVGLASVGSAHGAWHGLQVRLNGPDIQVWWDSQQRMQVSDWTNVSATKHGIWVLSLYDAGSLFGDFRVTGVPPPPPVASVTVSPTSLTLPVSGTKTAAATGYSSSNAVIPSATFTWSSSNPSIASVQSTGPASASITGTGVGSATITATSTNGVTKTLPVTVTASCIGQCVYDDLVGTPGLALTTHTPDVNVMGGSWSIGGSPSLIFWGAGVRVSNNGTSSVYATIESGASNGTVGASWYPQPGENQAMVNGGLVFRYLNASSYLVAYYWQGRLYLAKMTAAGLQPIADAALNLQLDIWHSLQVRLDGPSIEVWWDNERRLQAVDWTNVTATKHGIWGTGYDPGSIFGDFGVNGAAPPPPVKSVVVTPTSASIPVAGSKSGSAMGYTTGNVWVPSATFTWTTSNAAVATVQSTSPTTAVVTGVGAGTATITAHSSDGPFASQTVTVTATCLGSCVYDSFLGTGGLPLQTHTPETNVMGGGWTVTGAAGISIIGSHIAPATTGGSEVFATIESGTANGSVGATWMPLTGSAVVSPSIGLIVRYVSPTSYLLATYENSKVRLYKNNGGSFVQVAEGNTYDAVGSAHAFEVRLDGPGIQVWWDGEQRIQAVDSTNITATRHGVRWHLGTDAASYIDDFGVTGTMVSVPATVTVTPPSRTLPTGGTQMMSASAFTATNGWIPWVSFNWHSSNSSVATLQSTGLSSAVLTAVGSGTAVITGTSNEGGLSATMRVLVTVAENPAGVRVQDSFNGSGGLSISTHVPEVNVDSTHWVVTGNPDIGMFNARIRATGNGTGSDPVFGTIESGTSNGTVNVIWRPIMGENQATSNGGLVFRYADGFYWLGFYWQNSIYLYKRTAAGLTEVARTPVVNALNATHQFAAILDGEHIQLWWDGVLRLETTDSMNQTATRHGVLWYSQHDAGSWMDDFSVNTDFITPVYPPQPPVPCVNGVWPPTGQYWPTVGGTDSVTLSAPFECAWTAEATVPWIHLTSTSGIGDAYVEYSVDLNTGGQRTGAIRFGEWFYPITQAPGGNLAITFAVYNASTQQPVSGAAVSLLPDYGGLGARYTDSVGRVTYVVDGGQLQYTISKDGYLTLNDGFVVTQADTRLIWLTPLSSVEPPEECNVLLSPSHVVMGMAAASSSFEVAAPAGCAWSASTISPFLQITSGDNGVGSGEVHYSIAPNATGQERSAIINVNEADHVVTQRAVAANPVRVGPGADLWFDIIWDPVGNKLDYIGSTRNSIIRDAYQTVQSWPGAYCPCQMYWESWVDADLVLQTPNGDLVEPHYEWAWIIAQHPERHLYNPMPGQWRLNSRHRLLRDYYFVFWDPEEEEEVREYAGTVASEEWGGFDLQFSQPVTVQPYTGTLKLFLDVDGNFNPANAVTNQDDAQNYIPGAELSGDPVALPQTVRLIAAYTNASGMIVAPPSNGLVTFELNEAETSAFIGFAMNAGSSLERDYSLSGQTAAFGPDHTASVNLLAHDYGGFTSIRITHAGRASIPTAVPARAGSSLLPSAGWQSSSGHVSATDAGEDSDTGGANPGDGFVAFEEFRGFMVDGHHIRLNPMEKDLFVHSDFFGVGAATELPINFHLITSADYVFGLRRINFNYANAGAGGDSPNHYGQNFIRIQDIGASGAPAFGATGIDPNNPVPVPANVLLIGIFTKSIRRNSPPIENEEVVTQDKDIPMLLTTLAHEMGHAVGLEHYVDPADTCPASPQFWSHMIEQYFTGSAHPDWLCRWSAFPPSYRASEVQSFRLR